LKSLEYFPSILGPSGRSEFLYPGTGFLWPGAGRTGAQAGQLNGAGWPAAVRQAGGRTGSPAAGLPPYAAVRVCAAVGGHLCGLGVRVCGGWGVSPPYLSTFGSKLQAKPRFLGTANRARKVAFAWNREKRCAHLLQHCSTTLPLVEKMPNGGPVGGNEFVRGAKILDFSVKSQVSLMTDGRRTER
jgi:hypothetical protein